MNKRWSSEEERKKACGEYWRGIRQAEGRSVAEVSRVTGVSSRQFGRFESGILPLSRLPEQFFLRLASALKRFDALDHHIEMFEWDTVLDAVGAALEKGDPNGRALSREENQAIDRRSRAFAQHVDRLSRVKSSSDSHPTKLLAFGQFWKGEREAVGLKTSVVSERIGWPSDQLSMFEGGLLDPADLEPDFFEKLAKAIGVPDALARFEVFRGTHRRKRR